MSRSERKQAQRPRSRQPESAPTTAREAKGFSRSETGLYAAIFLAIAAIDLAARAVHLPPAPGSGAQDGLFGFSQLSWWGLLLTAAIGALIVTVPAAVRTRLDTPLVRAELAVACGVAFYLLRSWFINPDGALFPMKFMIDIPARGFHATHDEMWELYVHSKFWFYTNAWFGWSVDLSYQVLSCAAGAVFVFLLLTWARRLLPQHWPWAFLACISGGYMQLFFGDAENYTLTTTLVMAYFLASARSLEERTSVVSPSLLLATAITFHLEAGFLLPSLAHLWVVAWWRGAKTQVAVALTGLIIIVAGTLLFFHLEGLPIGDLFSHSHAFGDGGHFLQMIATPSADYYFQIANLAFLLVPAWVILLALLAYRRIRWDAVNVHLVVASGVMIAFVLCWRAQLGVYNDWNLFAMAAVPISLLVWRNVFEAAGSGRVPWPVVALVTLFFAHSYSWVIANHLL
jgi:hypothetical protein